MAYPLGRSHNVLGFVAEKTGGANARLHIFYGGLSQMSRSGPKPKQFRRDLVHPLVCALGGKNDRHQKLPGGVGIQMRLRRWVTLGKQGHHLNGQFLHSGFLRG